MGEPVWAMVLDGPRRLRRQELPRPVLGEDDALLRVEACGLCGTDHEQFTGALAAGAPFVPGHESVGVIEEIGPKAAQRWSVQQGDRVAVEVFQSCGTCPACLGGAHRRCHRHGIGDMYGFIPVERSPGLWGGYATHQYLAPDSQLLPVPDGMDPVLATVFNPLGAGLRWGASLPGTGPGDVVAVLGPGIRGISAVVAAKEAGAGLVLLAGRGDADADRLAWGAAFGADVVVDVARADPVAELRRATGSLADVVVDVTAKAPDAFAQAIALASPGGTVVVAGTRGEARAPGFDPDHLVYKELRILGALGVDTGSYRQALDLLASGRYPFADLPRQVRPTAAVGSLLQVMAGETDQVPPVHAVVAP